MLFVILRVQSLKTHNLITKRFPKENKILYNETNLILIQNITNIYDQ